MTDLADLKAKKDAYVKDEAQKIIQKMVNVGATSSTLATCNARNWDVELHNNMLDIAKELHTQGIRVSSQIRHGVTDWTFVVA